MLLLLDISRQMWSTPLSHTCCEQLGLRAVESADWVLLKKLYTFPLPVQFDPQQAILNDKLHAVLFLAGETPNEIIVHPDGIRKLTRKILKRLRKDAGFDC